MLGLDRYILRQLIGAMVLVTSGLSAILWLTQSLRFIEITLNRGASIWVFLKLTLLILPNFLTVILPVALFSVVLFTYNKLITDRELVVMRSAGLSHWALARPAVMLASANLVIGLILNMWIIPFSAGQFREMQWQLQNTATATMLQEGNFNEIQPGLTVYVRARDNATGELLGVIVHDTRNPTRNVTVQAERGALLKGEHDAPKVLLINGVRQQVSKDSDRLSLLYFDNYAMEFSDSSSGHGDRFRESRERSTQELFSLTEADVDAKTYRQFRVEGHQRLASPLYHFSFAFLAVGCLLPGWFNRRGQTDRLILAVGLMVAMQAMALGVTNIATSNLTFIPLLYLAPLLTALAGAWTLFAHLRPRSART